MNSKRLWKSIDLWSDVAIAVIWLLSGVYCFLAFIWKWPFDNIIWLGTALAFLKASHALLHNAEKKVQLEIECLKRENRHGSQLS